MESLGDPVRAVQEANQKLQLLLDILRPEQELFSAGAEPMAAALAEVIRVGELLRTGLAVKSEGPGAEELERYRRHLEQLKQLLPGVHARLLIERSRLEAERAHLDAAASWAHAAVPRSR